MSAAPAWNPAGPMRKLVKVFENGQTYKVILSPVEPKESEKYAVLAVTVNNDLTTASVTYNDGTKAEDNIQLIKNRTYYSLVINDVEYLIYTDPRPEVEGGRRKSRRKSGRKSRRKSRQTRSRR